MITVNHVRQPITLQLDKVFRAVEAEGQRGLASTKAVLSEGRT
jgi:hypothetical protein